jgi:hypothetical protein
MWKKKEKEKKRLGREERGADRPEEKAEGDVPRGGRRSERGGSESRKEEHCVDGSVMRRKSVGERKGGSERRERRRKRGWGAEEGEDREKG